MSRYGYRLKAFDLFSRVGNFLDSLSKDRKVSAEEYIARQCLQQGIANGYNAMSKQIDNIYNVIPTTWSVIINTNQKIPPMCVSEVDMNVITLSRDMLIELTSNAASTKKSHQNIHLIENNGTLKAICEHTDGTNTEILNIPSITIKTSK